VVVLGGLGLFILNSLLEVAITRGWVVGGRRMVYELTHEVFERLQQRSLAYHAQQGVSDSLSHVTGDTWALYQVVENLVVAPARALLTLGVMLWLMARLDAELMLVSLLLAPVAVAASMLAAKPLRVAARLKREIELRIQAHVQQTLTGISVVQLFTQEERQQRRFETYASVAVAAQQRSTFLGSLNSLSAGLVTALGTGVVLWLGARHVLAGTLTLGSLLAFVFWFNLLQNQVSGLAKIFSTLQGAGPSLERLRAVFDAAPEIADLPGAPDLPPAAGEVRFEGVTAGHEPGQAVLCGIDLEVPAGQRLAIVGPSGAGKTTLASLVPRLLDPWAGRVRIDGRDARSVKLKSLRAQIALVSQEPFLFPGSIADNLAWGRPAASRAEIEAAARAARAHEFIARLPAGYDTLLGERGATLSGGERQRLAIARALLKQAPILILDEPTSALDAQTEWLILEGLKELMVGRTTLMIAHRLSTVRCADRIIVLDNGKIVESGTYEDLLAQGGRFAAWHRKQLESKNAAWKFST
jgi:ATP-binding cassette subfamily B protein/subfamily B ATP-binding cassette protein MsbA